MSVRSFLQLLLTVLLPTALLSTLYLHAYPLFHGCAFPHPSKSIATSLQERVKQIFWLDAPLQDGASYSPTPPLQLLVLADPQLEGDTSLPDPENEFLPRMMRHWTDVTARNISLADRQAAALAALQDITIRDIPGSLQALRKRVDLVGNDYYLAHIYRTMYWWTRPTHVTVLGDLIGSQWLSDEEFEQRGWRYWNRVFSGAEKIDEEFFKGVEGSGNSLHNISDKDWSRRVINIAGNHDIGYAGDVTEERIVRFERTFGRTNWDIRFTCPKVENITQGDTNPTLHLVVLNSLVLDTPALSIDVQDETYRFVNSLMSDRSYPAEDRSSFTLLLTHVPLHKPAGICVDGPFFDFYDADEATGKFKNGGLKEQNHLSDHSSWRGILEGIFAMNANPESPGMGKGRSGLILNGHDHEGCDVWHYVPANETKVAVDGEQSEIQTNWQAVQWRLADMDSSYTGIREITLRSMMGEFGGNAGLLSAWFDFEAGEWRYEIQMCMLGVQHMWWAINILDLFTALVGFAWLTLVLRDSTKENRVSSAPQVPSSDDKQEKSAAVNVSKVNGASESISKGHKAKNNAATRI